MPSSLKWRLEVFNTAGEVIGMIHRAADGPPVLFGMADDLAFAAHDVRQIPQFLTDPSALGRAAYTAWRDVIVTRIHQMHAGGTDLFGQPATWEEMMANPDSAATIARWIAVGKAAHACDPTCN